MPKKRFELLDYDSDNGFSGFGLDHPRGIDLRPEIPLSTRDLVGIDLTHTRYADEVAYAKGGGGGPGGGGGGGGGGGTSGFAPYTSGPADGTAGYNITIEFNGNWTQAYYDIFVSAANFLSTLIIGDLQDVSVRSRGVTTVIDDIKITAELGAIDGLYGILGQAGPTAVRTSNSLPATAQMKFDIADVDAMGLDAFADVVLHEMAHSLGFGSIWDRLGLVTNGLFTGQNALAEFLEMGGSGSGIPVEQDGGSGTAGAHWDEETFNNELMTGYINEGVNPFSAMSAAAFADMGYVINPNYESLADPYMLA
ncbi:leishmanolysin-related zinc metalloendopeptidase [Sphingosinicella sp. YJ22]|uniref:leishmanolysin-related zinc metalloendopeptidase n=1 Tax=Sphingosinicella sp. YJ22 TaxID=1104780 RepID=UPI00140C97CB|nr:leishmanolysin-related zinc metalloendopeptidase [Sphingosinicella sp. YJ22]